MKHAPFCLFLTIALTCSVFAAPDRPNVVWLLSEDNSIHYLRLYGAALGATPNIDQLAKAGVTFDHAFSNAPVCSVARTTLMTGMLAPRAAFQFHRKSKLVALPPGARMFPAYLRAAGYYTTNNRKKDYNVVEGQTWDESSRKASWRNRPTPDTPFFHMQTNHSSHESGLHFTRATFANQKPSVDPSQVKLADYHPDTELFRYTQARYFDRLMIVDKFVGNLIRRLKADGVYDNTILFYFGDHGGVLPGSKGYAREAGLHVPLIVRVPPKWKHLLPRKPGVREQGFVSFIDFGPSVLAAAGLQVPESMDGKPFLGESATDLSDRQETWGHADRFDEKYDHVRWLRKGRFSYCRNYQCFYPDGLQNNYRYRMLAYQEWRQLYRSGKLNDAQKQFFQRRAPEGLYDVQNDPHEVNNLAGDPQYAAVLKDLRSRMQHKVKSLPDLSLYPESHLFEYATDNGVAFGQQHKSEIAKLVDIADLALVPFDKAEARLGAALASPNPWERYWGLIVCTCFGEKARPLVPAATRMQSDPTPLVRVRAAEFLGSIKAIDPRPTITKVLRASDSHVETLLALNTVVYLHDGFPEYRFKLNNKDVKSADGEVTRRLRYLGIATNAQKKGRAKKTSATR